VQAALDGITPGQFLVLEYLTEDDLPVEPYAQAALDPGGWYCEVVSDWYLPAHRWPMNELALARAGWQVRDDVTDNWWCADVDLASAAHLLVDALWNGRSCVGVHSVDVRDGAHEPLVEGVVGLRHRPHVPVGPGTFVDDDDDATAVWVGLQPGVVARQLMTRVRGLEVGLSGTVQFACPGTPGVDLVRE
jgi:Flp pilus assembly pilin Flp